MIYIAKKSTEVYIPEENLDYLYSTDSQVGYI